MDTVGQQIQRWKATALIFLDKKLKTFIRDANDDLYFCYIVSVTEDSLSVECFGPKQRAGEKITIYWPLITDFKPYEENRNSNDQLNSGRGGGKG
jgi:hypothetical protein